MAKPWIHAIFSAKKFGGEPEDYIDIHNLMDSSKATIADCRHRALTHNAWFIGFVVEHVFGTVRKNSAGKTYSVRDVAEQHCLEDYGGRFIPSAQDFLSLIPVQEWMNRGTGEMPESCNGLYTKTKVAVD